MTSSARVLTSVARVARATPTNLRKLGVESDELDEARSSQYDNAVALDVSESDMWLDDSTLKMR